ncbi:MAG: flagellar motor switch protein FliM [Clostridia bacterium]|jgi:flagellar motor switch protein FliM|nr:flagellar motor switch protein FliM [Clostridia bacterium]
MPEILSQNEIDKLLSELENQDIDIQQTNLNNEPVHIKYDFKSPKRINKDQIKMLTSIYENFSRHLASYLSGILRIYCEIKVESIEELPYFEYNNALPDSMLTGIFNIRPIDCLVLLDLSNNITFTLLERLLGGNLANDLILNREFTEIDISLVERIFKKSSVFLEDAWSNFTDTQVSLQQIETNSRLIQALSMDEVVVIITMTGIIKGVTGNISCCIPCINLEPLLDKLSNTHNTKREVENEQSVKLKEHIISKINNSSIELNGVLGNATLSLDEILNLQVGDVIKLERRIEDDIEIFVNRTKWFDGIPGVKHNKKALKINKVIQERDILKSE